MDKARILLIEDDEDNLELVRFLLNQEGYEVLLARDGRRGLELAETEQPNLILLDMSIPEIDGWKLAGILKHSPKTHAIGIVALTGHTAPGDRKRAIDAGCDGYISKPLDIPAFAGQVGGYLNKIRPE
jgi:CheY-like chemotaxis protein